MSVYTREWLSVYLKHQVIGAILIFFMALLMPFPALAATIAERITPCDGVQSNFYGSTGTRQQVAQSFVATSDTNLTDVTIFTAKDGSPTDGVFVEIQTDSGGSPSGSVVATSDTVSYTALYSGSGGTCTDMKETSVSITGTLTNGVTYWYVLKRTAAYDATNNYFIVGDIDHPAGSAKVNNSGSWVQAAAGGQNYYLNFGVYGNAGGGGGSSTTQATTTLAFWCDTSSSTTTYCYQHASSSALRTQDAGNITFMLGIIVFYMSVAFCGLLWTQATKA